VTPSTQVSSELEMRLIVVGGPSLPVAATVRYAAADPWAVRVVFQTGDDGEGVEWLFARELLSVGVSDAAGDGDVQVWSAATSAEKLVFLRMASPSGQALFEIDRDDLVEFLEQTYAVVPAGAEAQAVDLDDELVLLLGDA
jgi:hypothetical protein